MPGSKFFIPLALLLGWFGGRAWYFAPAAVEKELAPDFTAVRADGRTFALSDLRGKKVLLDFWGSWCGPCRRESAALTQLNQQYKDELTIVSIAIERDSTAWNRARSQDARSWPYQVFSQSASLKFLNGELPDLYGIKRVPSNVLVDEEGRVLGVNMDLNEVAAAL